MNGRELVLAALSNQKTARAPWVPFVGIHAASLLGCSADAYLRESALMIAGLERAIGLYHPDGLPVCFDLQLEAEICGCRLQWQPDNPPAVVSHPLAEGVLRLEDVPLPSALDGRMPEVLATLRHLRLAHPDLALYGLVTGPFTLALHLLGTEIFMQMYDHPEQVHRLLERCAAVGRRMAELYLAEGADVIAVVDPMTSQIGPEQFVEFCQGPIRSVFDHVRQLGGLGSLFVCGHARKNIEVMCQVHCDGLSIDENIPLAEVRDICRRHGISFGGNLQLTLVMLLGDVNANRINAVRCLETGGDTGYILSPGCDIPYAVPPENIVAAGEVAVDPYARQVAAELARTAEGPEIMPLDLSAYYRPEVVTVDLVTLDSQGCAPCQYMVAAAEEAGGAFGGRVVCREHKIKTHAGLRMMASLGVTHIPTLCIDGRIAFVSTIPGGAQLRAVLAEQVQAKGL